MGLFRNKKNTPPKYLQEDSSDLFKKYKDLNELLLGETTVGSRDIKKTNIYFDGFEAQVFSRDGVINHVQIPDYGFSLSDRLYWEDFDYEIYNKLEDIPDYEKNNYHEIIKHFPEHKELFANLFYNKELDDIMTLDKMIRATEGVTALTEFLTTKEDISQFETNDYFNLTPEQIEKVVEKYNQDLQKELFKLKLDSENMESRVVESLNDKFEGDSPLERFVVTGSSNSVTVGTLLSMARGFYLPQVIETINYLTTDGKIKLVGGEEVKDIELPDAETILALNDENVQRNDLLDELVESPTEQDHGMLLDDNELHHELDDDEDDWTFENHNLGNQGNLFTSTEYINDDVIEPIATLLDSYHVKEEEKEKIVAKLHMNRSLEEDLVKIEEDLKPLTQEYNEGVQNYDTLKFKNDFERLKNDDEDPSESELESNDDIPEMIEIRNESNKEFFNLEQLEKQRYELNETRKKLLYGVMGQVPFDPEDEDTVKVQELIDNKVKGIDNVRNVAFHFVVTQTEPENVETEKEYLVDIDEPDGLDAHPDCIIYYAIAEEMGFDPIAEYKARKREERDQVNEEDLEILVETELEANETFEVPEARVTEDYLKEDEEVFVNGSELQELVTEETFAAKVDDESFTSQSDDMVSEGGPLNEVNNS